ncbi:hypothetical protein PR048_021098 [Dryococelus australis]|uniref:Uncharacterized protein n=1 Tax=Dryococelus australis TaxID=614101 RepID=A0ABQ9GXE0_9NEOP|nr:hypothetical protein PR048_021098 [Dryococelus australis]
MNGWLGEHDYKKIRKQGKKWTDYMTEWVQAVAHMGSSTDLEEIITTLKKIVHHYQTYERETEREREKQKDSREQFGTSFAMRCLFVSELSDARHYWHMEYRTVVSRGLSNLWQAHTATTCDCAKSQPVEPARKQLDVPGYIKHPTDSDSTDQCQLRTCLPSSGRGVCTVNLTSTGLRQLKPDMPRLHHYASVSETWQLLPASVNTKYIHDLLPEYLGDVALDACVVIRFQQDGLHFVTAVCQHLDVHFQNQWIGRGGPITKPPQSPDIIPSDFWLWGHIRLMMYATPLDTKNELITQIRRALDTIKATPETFANVSCSMLQCCTDCMTNVVLSPVPQVESLDLHLHDTMILFESGVYIHAQDPQTDASH